MDIQSDSNSLEAAPYKNEINLKVSPFFCWLSGRARTRDKVIKATWIETFALSDFSNVLWFKQQVNF